MRRREFIAGLSGAAAWPVVARAQRRNGQVAHIAYLGMTSPSSLDPRQIEGFKQGLTDNGLIEGRDIIVDYVWAEGRLDRLRQLATELVRHNLDLIVTAGPQPVRALLQTQTQTPIVFAIYSDPVVDGVIDSLARPGRNLTGLSMANSNLESKRLQILKDAISPLTRVAILHDPAGGPSGLIDVQSGARELALETLILDASDPGRFDSIFAEAANHSVNGLAGMASPFLNFHHKRLIDLANQYRFPSIWESSGYVRDGGMLSYGPSFADMYRQSADYVAKILNGAKPSDLPVEQPVKFELAINLRTAKSLGILISPAILARADEVIE
jgi:putative tryptophan/tyrosine transport system substrate-binding protein